MDCICKDGEAMLKAQERWTIESHPQSRWSASSSTFALCFVDMTHWSSLIPWIFPALLAGPGG